MVNENVVVFGDKLYDLTTPYFWRYLGIAKSPDTHKCNRPSKVTFAVRGSVNSFSDLPKTANDKDVYIFEERSFIGKSQPFDGCCYLAIWNGYEWVNPIDGMGYKSAIKRHHLW